MTARSMPATLRPAAVCAAVEAGVCAVADIELEARPGRGRCSMSIVCPPASRALVLINFADAALRRVA